MAGTGNAHLRGDGMVLRANDINVEFNLGDKKIVKAVSGVSLDQEAADLIRFQQAYQAAAKILQVASQLFESVLSVR